ncbi:MULTISPECIES: NYN domain-containing protein [unclassified Haematospirillum]|uniref:LabA-like NYN domain-containing protein n=1 Tax=unclassified Haematospirillum TaxID=2622088 RepID=UPI00143AE4F8|nr:MULTISPECIES: NYN domain-containing protein [unclassified Haematospirillum]NKD54361.1 NYN domain-containing protein [Haematospirillum sp. H4890]NKD74405.1 NYN domain-containing protein [Haematospirillum sp. H4485]NKD86924.1 NYN domain-containing protein [Haematospirillum sp. 15-248]
MIFYPAERIALFIDGSSLYAAARALGFDIDYRKLLDLFATKGRLIRAFYYTVLIEDQDYYAAKSPASPVPQTKSPYSSIKPLVDWLDYNGYTMVTKPATKEYVDASGRRKARGSMDIEMAVDVMEMSEHLDHIVLFSGDGDLRRLVEAVQKRGLRVTVVSTVKSSSPIASDDLRRQADNFLELLDLEPLISRSGIVRQDERQHYQAHNAPQQDVSVTQDENAAS